MRRRPLSVGADLDPRRLESLCVAGPANGLLRCASIPDDVAGSAGRRKWPGHSGHDLIDTVAVNIHGNVDEAQLRAIAESIRPRNDTEWAALVAAVQAAP